VSVIRGSYFVSDDEKYVIVGRVSIEYAETRHHLTALMEEAEKLRKIFQQLGSALHRPQWMMFDGEPMPAGLKTYEGFKPSDYAFESSTIDGARLKVLCDEIRETTAKLERLEEKKRNLGI
jgi:hypothetical protein